MDFRKLKIPTLTGREDGYFLEHQFNVQNGDIECKVWLCITERAAIQWYKDNPPSIPDLTINDVLSRFSQAHVQRFQNISITILHRLIQQYHGFPSPLHLTEQIFIIFDVGEYSAMCQNYSMDFKRIIVAFDVKFISRPDKEIMGAMSHELYHVISKMHEAENTMRDEMIGLHNKFSRAIDEDRAIFEKSIKELIQYCESNQLVEHQTERQIAAITQYFYMYNERFWNLIADSALCFIAMELNDREYVDFSLAREREKIPALEEKLGQMNKAMRHAREKEQNRRKRAYLLSVLRMIQFIRCFDFMPYESVAYGVAYDNKKKPRGIMRLLSRYKALEQNEALEIINLFRNAVKKNCDRAVSKGFLRFYESYLHIIGAQAMRNNPLDPNLPKQIHSIESIGRAKESYKTLNREFNRLFQELKKLEQLAK